MNQEMFGALPDGTVYTRRRNLWDRPKVNVTTYKGHECEKWSCGLKTYYAPSVNMLAKVGPVGRETHFTVSFDYILILRETGTTNPMRHTYAEGYIFDETTQKSKWFGEDNLIGDTPLQPCEDWTHQRLTYRYQVSAGYAIALTIHPAYLRDIDADLYIRNIMICYGDEDYPYTPAPEIDETVVLTEGAG